MKQESQDMIMQKLAELEKKLDYVYDQTQNAEGRQHLNPACRDRINCPKYSPESCAACARMRATVKAMGRIDLLND